MDLYVLEIELHVPAEYFRKVGLYRHKAVTARKKTTSMGSKNSNYYIRSLRYKRRADKNGVRSCRYHAARKEPPSTIGISEIRL